MDELKKKERNVRELTEMIKADVSTVSKHLSILRNAGFVDADKRGGHVYYWLLAPCAEEIFDCLTKQQPVDD